MRWSYSPDMAGSRDVLFDKATVVRYAVGSDAVKFVDHANRVATPAIEEETARKIAAWIRAACESAGVSTELAERIDRGEWRT